MARVRMTRGRQRIEIRKITKKSSLLVTFSKRRFGLFKKVSELCTLCASDIVVIVFSPGDKVFSFGHPSVDMLVDRFLTGGTAQGRSQDLLRDLEPQRNYNIRRLNMQLTHVLELLENERKTTKKLNEMRRESMEKRWWEAPTVALPLQQLEQLKVGMEELKRGILKLSEKYQMEGLGTSGGPINMGAGSSGGQARAAIPPQVPPQVPLQLLPQHPHLPPPLDVDFSELGLSLTPHGYALGFVRGRGHGGRGGRGSGSEHLG